LVAPTAGPALFAFSSSSANIGWAAGGVEYALPANWSNWSVKVEYLYYDLGRTTSNIFYQYAPNSSTVTGSIRHNGNIVRAGLNYRFNWWTPAPVVARY
jgi:outer membrane immunogenic protein